MSPAEKIKENKKQLEREIERLLKEFIIVNGEMSLTVSATTYYSPQDNHTKMHSNANVEIKIL